MGGRGVSCCARQVKLRYAIIRGEMKARWRVWTFAAVALSAVFVFWARMSPQKRNDYLATRALCFYYDPIMDASTGTVSRAEYAKCQDLVVDAVFHMRSAVNFINRESSRKGLVGRFMAAHPEWNNGDSEPNGDRPLLRGEISCRLAMFIAEFVLAYGVCPRLVPVI